MHARACMMFPICDQLATHSNETMLCVIVAVMPSRSNIERTATPDQGAPLLVLALLVLLLCLQQVLILRLVLALQLVLVLRLALCLQLVQLLGLLLGLLVALLEEVVELLERDFCDQIVVSSRMHKSCCTTHEQPHSTLHGGLVDVLVSPTYLRAMPAACRVAPPEAG
jgi:hypothetical protein